MTNAPVSLSLPSAAAAGRTQAETPARLPRVRRWGGRWYARRALEKQVVAAVERFITPGAGGRLVDYGCGDMPYRALLEPRVEGYVGLDLPGNSRAEGWLNAAGGTDLPNASARWVLSTQVLEHAPDPQAYLAECRRLLEPSGHLLLSTHGHWRFHPHPDDFWRWTSQGLRQILDDAGFAVAGWSGALGLGAVGTVMLQDAVVRRLPRVMRAPVATGFQWACAAADRLQSDAAREEDAAIYVVVATPKSAEPTTLEGQEAC